MCHVLIIEDEILVAMDIEACLSEHGATSFAFADTEACAVAEARLRTPALIMSDVKLLVGTGPQAVQMILAELGPIPVIFLTATPESCRPCKPPARILTKPMHAPTILRHLRELAPFAPPAPVWLH